MSLWKTCDHTELIDWPIYNITHILRHIRSKQCLIKLLSSHQPRVHIIYYIYLSWLSSGHQSKLQGYTRKKIITKQLNNTNETWKAHSLHGKKERTTIRNLMNTKGHFTGTNRQTLYFSKYGSTIMTTLSTYSYIHSPYILLTCDLYNTYLNHEIMWRWEDFGTRTVYNDNNKKKFKRPVILRIDLTL